MGRGGAERPPLLYVFENGYGEGRPFGGVGARAQLVEKREGADPYILCDLNDVLHVGGEGGQALLDALLVADIGKDVFKNRDLASLVGANLQTGGRHRAEKPDGF
ncbi:hypothetical protein SDC9_191511 [bioreactor metagenome]|uniref:Uncharacterized protein n=1 Tax=bioreactor metagenome TaxID=1076179 RepID=A0A645HYI5_9ZZZZ